MRRIKGIIVALCLFPATPVAWGGEVTGFVLVNADTDRDVRPLKDGATLDPVTDGESLSIRADVSGAVGSVRFDVDGRTVRIESTAPFAVGGDSRGDYAPWPIDPGRHTLTATPYAEAGGRGDAGKAMRITFTVAGRVPGAPPRRTKATPEKPRTEASATPVPPAVTLKPGTVAVSGELKRWHKVTLSFAGPAASETAEPNPFTDYRLNVTFRHGDTTMVVPGYYAADGRAADTGAAAGNVWRAHLSPPATGTWTWTASFRKGPNVAVAEAADAGAGAGHFDGSRGSFTIAPTDKTGRDHRGKGLLQYVGRRYLRFAGSGGYFLKQGADAPENFLAYADFDGDFKSDGQKDNFIKTWAPHVRDWRPGDPTWAGGKGKGIIGAVNYLASEGINAISFLTLNIGGDDRNVFPYRTYHERTRMDVSRLAQWEIVLEHMDRRGIYLHFKTQETENELLLDGGDLGSRRKLYYRELIARFAHHPALNWNLGEEINNASTRQKQSWAQYFHDHDPYRHPIVIHNGHPHYDLLGAESKLTGFSLQTNRPDFRRVHDRVADYINRSVKAGKPWVVACDEPGDASHALVPDEDDPAHDNARSNGLWGCLMAGGAGNEWYFGYKHAHSDLTCEDWRSRDLWWDQCRAALAFFNTYLPFWEMTSCDDLTGGKGSYGFAKRGEIYVVYTRSGAGAKLDLTGVKGAFEVKWYDPRKGGKLQDGSVRGVAGGGVRDLGKAPGQAGGDWAILVRRPSAR